MMKRYNEKAKKSFKAKWNIYLFDKIMDGKELQIDEKDFKNFILTDKIVNRYTNDYWQKETDDKVGSLTISEIDSAMSNYEYGERSAIAEFERNYIEETFPMLMSIENFKKLVESKECYYCNTLIDEIHQLGENGRLRKKNLRGWTLEIDRIKPNFEYTLDNCVMSCYWCNHAKADEFSEEEFKSIGKEIGRIFKSRLSKINNS